MRGAEGLQLGGPAVVAVAQQLIVRPAVDEAVAHAERVSLGQQHAARRTREAVQVEDGVSGAHHQLTGRDAGLTPGAPLHREQPAQQ